MTEETAQEDVVHVLVTENFFRERIDAALQALKRRPSSPDLGSETDVFDQIVPTEAIGLVADLEDDQIEILPLLARIRSSESTSDLDILAYCSHHRQDLIQAAEALGAQVVPRSTFAANLVRLLMGLGPEEPDPQGGEA